ncbi:DNA mismatch repair protein MutS, partial [candidate division WOR-3 bacterium]|nr:DNA mismatch repair protein MutS [candidate division WOR-3 bacterium]
KALDTYVGRLVALGFKVAVCEQLEPPDAHKPVVARAVVEVITPGTVTNPSLLETRRNNYLLAISPAADRCGIAFADVSTGEFSVGEVAGESLAEEMQKLDPAEVLAPESWQPDSQLLRRAGLTRVDEYYFTQDYAFDKLSAHLGVANLDGFGIGALTEGICAAGAVLHYLEETQKTSLRHLRRIAPYQTADFLLIDRLSRRNLELVERMSSEQQRLTAEGTLLSVLDRTRTPAGTRLLRRWLLAPLLDVESIRARQDAVEELSRPESPLTDLESLLERVGDIGRISSRVALERANARDLVALRTWLEVAPKVKQALGPCGCALLTGIREGIEDFSALTKDVADTLVDDPPLALNEGGMIRPGRSPELDELRTLAADTKGFIARLQEAERERTGIPNLRIRFNSVFGYYIEVTKSYLGQAPRNYLRKQTVLNAERFITPELKEHETRVLNAEERMKQIEFDLFVALRKRVGSEPGRLLGLSALLAELDVFCSLARVAREPGYTRPVVDDSAVLEIAGGRHPVVERLLAHQFVANDTQLGARVESRTPSAEAQNAKSEVRGSTPGVRGSEFPQIVILTGPNMAGKSTYLRQVALMVIMAQVGSFVPAERARVGVVDKLFTRIGASDDLSRGVSTFLAEMTETANILNNATSRSLVILDEIGRGTATSDGIAIAWATVEYLHGTAELGAGERPARQVRPKTLFATHYHELTDIVRFLPRCANFGFTVREQGGQVLFLRKLKPGPADKSYGIAVARLAGLPLEVIERAKQVILGFERGEEVSMDRLSPERELMAADRPSENPVLAELRAADLENLSPLQAFDLLRRLQQRLEAQSGT